MGDERGSLFLAPQKTKFSPVFPRPRPTLQRHARRITSTATTDGNATRHVRVEVRGDDPDRPASYLRIEERELEAGGLNEALLAQVRDCHRRPKAEPKTVAGDERPQTIKGDSA